MKLIFTEITALASVGSHPFIVELLYHGVGLYQKKTGFRQVRYIVTSLAAGGELFNIVHQTGRFEERLAQHYFSQLVQAVDFFHQ